MAYECIQKENDGKNYAFLHKQPMLCKSILYEFAIKKNMNEPVYDTILYAREQGSVYVCHVVLKGIHNSTYMGEEAVNKKTAEQLAARAAIESLLKTDDARTLSQIIMSKDKCRHGIRTRKDASSGEKMQPKCSGNLQDQNSKDESAVVSVNTDGIVDSFTSGQKRKTKTNSSKRNKKRRSGN